MPPIDIRGGIGETSTRRSKASVQAAPVQPEHFAWKSESGFLFLNLKLTQSKLLAYFVLFFFWKSLQKQAKYFVERGYTKQTCAQKKVTFSRGGTI